MKFVKFVILVGFGFSDFWVVFIVLVIQLVVNFIKLVRIFYLIEQIFYYFFVSVFYIDCFEKGFYVKGFDQIIVKFIGIFIKVMFGEYNLGIFIMVDC